MEKLCNQQADIEQIQKKVSALVMECIEDIQETVTSSGLQMRDVGVRIERFETNTGLHIVELRLSQ